MTAFNFDCWKRPRHFVGRWDAFHYRAPTPLTVAVRKERTLTAKLQANPLPTPYWLTRPAPPTLARISKGLDWTRDAVHDSEWVHYANCTEWLKARRAQLGLTD